MLLGDTCTRGCRFCAVKTAAQPPALDPDEPMNVAAEVASWDIDYVVLTSVDRDDLPDGGAAHFACTVRYLKQLRPSPSAVVRNDRPDPLPTIRQSARVTPRPLFVECLVSDFAGNADAVQCLALSGLDVYAHNLETVDRLQRYVRDPRASYKQSLHVLSLAKQFNSQLVTKTSLMLGLGEAPAEVIQTMRDLRERQVDVITLGQYLRPSKHHLSVVEWIHPDQFAEYRRIGEKMGFLYVAAGPLVRSSYRAGEYMMTRLLQQRELASRGP
ncbi:Lip1pp [Cyanidiococcus yangmingshanensis]|uniref:Lipoyl synthase, mitochondrial n=1 Tax=Cyanidiococcus yangmingshanensis TaxID=2690220 RepID=A0A7J7ILI0_9RHOD|nr:Lip1pp [Cyanidiococcus yangmingshanensis]